jgi:hypothetical protein
VAIFNLKEISLAPNVLIFFGLILFFMGLWFTVVALINMKGESEKRENFFTVGFYMLFYLLFYPIILIISGYKFLRGYRKW